MNRFLRSPSLFPARIAGEPWGSQSVTIELPGGPVWVGGLSEVQATSLRERFGEATASNARYGIAVFRAAASDFLEIDTRGWEYELEIDGPRITGMNLMARLGDDRAAIWTPVSSRDAFWGVVENVLRPLVARRLLKSGGLLVHSAAIVVDGRGFLFTGQSGAGKSTIAGMAIAAGREVVSDDLNAIREGSILPSPFTGDLSSAEIRRSAAPLHAIVALEKGSGECMRPLSAAATTSLLVRCAPYVNRDAALADALLDRAHDLARATRGGVLTFRRGGDVWPILSCW